MSGIAGLLDLRAAASHAALRAAAESMGNAVAHRGRDGSGVWVDAGSGVALAQRGRADTRRPVGGHEPLRVADSRFVVVHDSAVPNLVQLRRELEARGHRFRRGSDAEVTAEACEEWGVEGTARRLLGAFALAVWDRAERRLTLVRDRLGVKPLFWGRHGDTVLFASQPGAFAARRPRIDRVAVAQYLHFSYVPAPRSIWEGISKLRPGHLVTIAGDGSAREACYWDLPALAADGAQRPIGADDEEAAGMLDDLVRDAVRWRLAADVPFGAFLSGGIDSSTVVALMQAQSSRPVRTFTVGFAEDGYDEAVHARAVAAHLGAEHTELRVETGSLAAVVPRLAGWFDEPFGDPSGIVTLMLSELMRRSVDAVMGGDGGDELFGGYTRYHLARRMARLLGGVPRWARSAAARCIRVIPCGAYDVPLRALPRAVRPPPLVGDRAHKLAGLLDFRTPDDLYAGLASIWERRLDLVPGAGRDPGPPDGRPLAAEVPEFSRRMLLLDQLTYLPDWELAKVDRATAAVGLEAHAPLLDHRIVELSWRLPDRHLFRDGQGKWLLRRVLERHVPRRLFERPKHGFESPVGVWLRGPLREWAEDLLSRERLEAEGLLDAGPIRQRLAEHLSGRRNWQYQLWCILMLQAWRARWAAW